MKILILSPSFPTVSFAREGESYGGTFVLTEALAYNTAGAEVTVLTPHAPGLPLRETIREGLEVVRFRYFFPAKWQMVRIVNYPLYTRELLWLRVFQIPLFIVAYFLSIYRLLDRADIIHANWTPTALLALPYMALCKIPVVLTYRGKDLDLLPRFLNRFIIRKVTAVLDVWGDTQWIRKNRALFPGRYIKLPHITRAKQNPSPKPLGQNTQAAGKTKFVFVGRLGVDIIDELKGVGIIIPASQKLQKQYDSFDVHILGDGPARRLLEVQHREPGVADYVFLHGHQENVFPFIADSSAVLGGMGLNAVAQEAALCKALLLIPDVPEHNGTMWTHMKTALLYNPKDADSLAEMMSYIIEHPEECAKIAVAGFNNIRKYVVDIEEGSTIYNQAFHRIIEDNRISLPR